MTRYPAGSIREIAYIALPLMLNNLSTNVMLFLDRLILAHYSTEAMNAAITIGIACSIVLFAATAITSTAEIFVGRYNGSEDYASIGRPVWQMLWFSLLSVVIFVPLGLFASDLFIPPQYQQIGSSFYHWYMFCGPIFPVVMALTSFYIGRGKIKLVSFVLILGNLINLVLAIILILGVKDIVPALGMKGAAIATIIAQSIQAIILFSVFLNKENKLKFGTGKFRLHMHSFIDCLKTGVPVSIGYMIEVGAWAFILRTLTTSGSEYVTVFAIGQSLFILFSFISEGLQKSITILASNFLGANKWLTIPTMLKSAIKLQMVIAVVMLIPMIYYADNIIDIFIVKGTAQSVSDIKKVSFYALIWFWLFFVCDGVKWILASTLISLKNTNSAMLINFASIWFFAVLPTYFYLGKYPSSPVTVWMFIVLYSLLNAALLMLRYRFSFKKDYANS
jgi:MATE family multidrug resistance protein